MTNGWSGADPTQQTDGVNDRYELATKFTANSDIQITAIRVWANQTVNVANRNALIWNSDGSSTLATINIDDSLPTSGWTTFSLVTPLDITEGTEFYVSYGTQQYYGAMSGGYPRLALDGAVTSTAGRFATTIGNFPNTATTSFYGIDIVFTAQGNNLAPTVTTLNVTTADLQVATTAVISDEDTATCTMQWDWGDGSTTTTGAGVTSSSHTYSSSGLYAIMATVTDSAGLDGSKARAVNLSSAVTALSDEDWIQDLLDAVMQDVQLCGYFDKVNGHEPKRAPDNGPNGMTAAIWVISVNPVALASGLAATSALITFNLRMYMNMLSEPQDEIDPRMVKALSNLMRRYHDDFDFGGLIRNIDVFGQFGVTLNAQSGYLDVDRKHFRIIDLTIPCIVNDVWTQV